MPPYSRRSVPMLVQPCLYFLAITYPPPSFANFLKLIKLSPMFGLFFLVIFKFCKIYVRIAPGSCPKRGFSELITNCLYAPIFKSGENYQERHPPQEVRWRRCSNMTNANWRAFFVHCVKFRYSCHFFDIYQRQIVVRGAW